MGCKNCKMELVYLCFECGEVADAAKVQVVLDAAEELTDTFTNEGFGRCWIALNTAVRNLKEMENK